MRRPASSERPVFWASKAHSCGARRRPAMKNRSEWVIGIDLGDRKSDACRFNQTTGELEEFKFAMKPDEVRRRFAEVERCEVVLEVGAQSRWVAKVFRELGFDVRTTNPRHNLIISKSLHKTDRNDARKLAKMASCCAPMLQDVEERSEGAQLDLAIIRIRDLLVDLRTALINGIRGGSKQFDVRYSGKSPDAFWKSEVPSKLEPVFKRAMRVVQELCAAVRHYDVEIADLAKKKYPQTAAMRQIDGVGALTSTAFALVIDDPKRFKKSRDVAAYLGLVPRKCESGGMKKQLGITKTGDRLMRRLLVQCASYILGPFGPDCDLRRFGSAIAKRGGRAPNKRARVAVARKLAILMHRLWLDGKRYEPLRRSEPQPAAAS
jgi:transposase